MLIYPGPWASCPFANSPKKDQWSHSISPPANYQKRPEYQEWVGIFAGDGVDAPTVKAEAI